MTTIPDAKLILMLLRGCEDDVAVDLLEQYTSAVSAKAVSDAVGQAYDHVMAIFATPAERGTLQ
jgi:hypothetical protein